MLTLGFLWADLAFHTERAVSARQALVWTILAVIVAGIVGIGIFLYAGTTTALEFFTTYILEKSLSIDNLFVILILFEQLHIPDAHQHRILFWGILGAIVFRAIFIALGVVLVKWFAPILYIFALLLLYSGIHLLFSVEAAGTPKLLQWFQSWTQRWGWDSRTDKFLVKKAGRWKGTMGLMALLAIEGADLLFAVDSVPAGLAISQEPFVLFSANICAILGLRSLYFLIASPALQALRRVVPWLLIGIGVQMLLAHWIVVPAWGSLLFIAIVLLSALLIDKKRV